MIRFACPNCQSSLEAKDEIAGQRRRCPKCQTPVVVPGGDAAAGFTLPPPPAPPGSQAAPGSQPPPDDDIPDDGAIRHFVRPERLVRHHRYLILDRIRLFAAWESDTEGWILRMDNGFAPVQRNIDRLPNQGEYRLVQLKMDAGPDHHLLAGLTIYQLAYRYALVKLPRGDDAILQSVVGHAGLNRDQKYAVRRYLGERMMREMWGGAQNVLDYLGNFDFHSFEI